MYAVLPSLLTYHNRQLYGVAGSHFGSECHCLLNLQTRKCKHILTRLHMLILFIYRHCSPTLQLHCAPSMQWLMLSRDLVCNCPSPPRQRHSSLCVSCVVPSWLQPPRRTPLRQTRRPLRVPWYALVVRMPRGTGSTAEVTALAVCATEVTYSLAEAVTFAAEVNFKRTL